MLRDDESAAAGETKLRLVREDPSARCNDVALETEGGLVDLVPNAERNAGMLAVRRRGPPGQQIFVVDEEAAVLENRRGKRFAQR